MKTLTAYLSLFTILLSGCASTEIVLHKNLDSSAKPSYEDYFDYYLLGFVGKNEVSLPKVCMDQKPYGLKAQRSTEDFLISCLTFGIYTPLTIQVWCGN